MCMKSKTLYWIEQGLKKSQSSHSTDYNIEKMLVSFSSEHMYLYTRASLVTQLVKNLPAMQETSVPLLGWKDPLEEGMATHSSSLAGKSHEQRSLIGYSPWIHKESDTTKTT